MGYLQGRVRVREELSKVLLFVKNDKFRSERPRTIILGFTHREPRSGLRSRNRTGFADAGFVEALSILIGCAICLSSWLHPDDSINELVRSVGSRSWSESFFFSRKSVRCFFVSESVSAKTYQRFCCCTSHHHFA